jgi:lysophospholipase L1-like esterase
MSEPSRGAATSRARGGRLVRTIVFTLLLVVALIGVDLVVLETINPVHALGHHYYMALGDSLSFGYQPNFDFGSGFVDDVYADLRKANVTDLVNYACSGETTTTLIQGGCPARFFPHDRYSGPQLEAAIAFLRHHREQVSPVTLEIGANDVLSGWDSATCQPAASATADLATMDQNLTQVILPELTDALTAPSGVRSGDLHLLNYYNPFARICPNSAPFVHLLNDHLAADAARFRVPVVDVYAAFGGDMGMAQNVCEGTLGPDGKRHPLTWMCNSQFRDIHPTSEGYLAIASAVELALGLPGTSPLPGIMMVGYSASGPGEAYRREVHV